MLNERLETEFKRSNKWSTMSAEIIRNHMNRARGVFFQATSLNGSCYSGELTFEINCAQMLIDAKLACATRNFLHRLLVKFKSKTIDSNVIYNFIGLENGYANGYEKRHENGYTNGFDHNGNSNVSKEENEDEQLSGNGKKRPRHCADFVFFFIAYKFYYFLSGFTEIIDDDSDVRPVISLASHCSAKSLFKELLFPELIA